MHDLNHILARSKQAHQALLDALTTERQLNAARNEPYTTESLVPAVRPSERDELAYDLQARQRRLEALNDLDAIAERARQRVMAGARAEFAAVMQQLNADQSYTLAQGQGKRALKKMPTEPLLRGAKADTQPLPQLEPLQEIGDHDRTHDRVETN